MAIVGGGGSYVFFTNRDLANRSIDVGGSSMQPLSSGHVLWYYVAAVSVLAAAVGLFGMISALAANRRAVKAFEAFYFLALMTQLALIIWALIWCKQNQTEFDVICNASKDGQVQLPIPGFADNWTCQKIYMAGIITIGVGGILWVGFNFFMTNRVIHYARELFNERADRYKVLGEAAVKELDREQQIPLNYTNVGSTRNDAEYNNNHFHQPSFRDEIEYKDPRSDDSYQFSRSTAAAGVGSFGQGVQLDSPRSVAPGFSHRSSIQGLDLVNPYHGEHDVYPGQMAMETIPTPIAQPLPYTPQGAGQSFVHNSNNVIASPFGDEEPIAQGSYSNNQDIKVQVPTSPHDDVIRSPINPPPGDLLSQPLDHSSSK
ncbi:hypothetical protein BGZ76_000875 [Entomortierella beljakovae]|nr:hypothetical protein BGZ76_000875 [Entomortierella beljakovae]